MGDYIVDIYLSAKFHCNLTCIFAPPLTPLPPPHICKDAHWVRTHCSATFLVLFVQATPCSQALALIFISVKRHFMQGCAFSAAENETLHVYPNSGKKEIFWQFLAVLTKTSSQKGLNSEDFMSKCHLFENLCLWKLMLNRQIKPQNPNNWLVSTMEVDLSMILHIHSRSNHNSQKRLDYM